VIWDDLFEVHPAVEHLATYWIDVSSIDFAQAYRVKEYMKSIGATRTHLMRCRYEIRDLDGEVQEHDIIDMGFDSLRFSDTEVLMRKRLEEELALGEDGFELARCRAIQCRFASIDRFEISMPRGQGLTLYNFWESDSRTAKLITPWVDIQPTNLLGDGDWVELSVEAKEERFRYDIQSDEQDQPSHGIVDTRKSERDEIAAAMKDVWGDDFALPEVEEVELSALDREMDDYSTDSSEIDGENGGGFGANYDKLD
jgi:hypothetical protein